jgi:hypothetical protein
LLDKNLQVFEVDAKFKIIFVDPWIFSFLCRIDILLIAFWMIRPNRYNFANEFQFCIQPQTFYHTTPTAELNG